MIKKKFIINFSLILLSVFITLYILEIFLKIYYDNTISCLTNRELKEKKSIRFGYNYDKRFIYEYAKDLKLKTSFGNTPKSFIIKKNKNEINLPFLPLSSYSNERIYLCNETGEHSFFTSDRYGFNNPNIAWENNFTDVLLLGDSFIAGSCINKNNENNFADIFRSKNFNTINLGFPGHGPLLEYATFIEYGKFLKPKKVLWFYYEGNDFNGLNIEKQSKILKSYLNDKRYNLKSKQKKINDLLYENEYSLNDLEKYEKNKIQKNRKFCNLSFQKTRELINFKELRNLIFKEDTNLKEEDFNEENFLLFEEIILKTKKEIDKWDGELIFIYLPKYMRYKEMFVDHDNYNKKKRILNLVNKNDIKTIDIHNDFFQIKKDPLKFFPLRGNGHYNKEGVKKISHFIFDNIYK